MHTSRCSCRCTCVPAADLSRRDFLKTATAAAVTGATLAAGTPQAEEGTRGDDARSPFEARNGPGVFEGRHLADLAMPLGGLGAGNVWVDGKGRLVHWQIFHNNYNEDVNLPAFFAIRAQAAGRPPVLRALQTEGVEGFPPVESMAFQVGYPIGTLHFQDGELPLKVCSRLYSPMVPLKARDSGLPCAVFELTVENGMAEPVEVGLLGALQNAAALDGTGSPQGRRYWSYGGNRNDVCRHEHGCALVCTVPDTDGSRLARPKSLTYFGKPKRAFLTCANLTLLSPPAEGRFVSGDVVWVEGVTSAKDIAYEAAVDVVARSRRHRYHSGPKLLVENAGSLLALVAAEQAAARKAGVALPAPDPLNEDFPEAFLSGQVTPEVGTVVIEGVPWNYANRYRIPLQTVLERGWCVLAADERGEPLAIIDAYDCAILVLADNLPAQVGLKFLALYWGFEYTQGDGIPEASPLYGNIAFTVLSPDATVQVSWEDSAMLARQWVEEKRLSGPDRSAPSAPGETVNGAMALDFVLGPGESRTVPFVLTWYFPNFERFGHRGMMYASWYGSALDVARDVCSRFDQLRADTFLFHQTFYETNLPPWLLDRISCQSSSLRSLLCFWARENYVTGTDYFAGDEGAYQCCPLNCNHVWGYAQTHAYLFPEIARNMRRFDFKVYRFPNGMIRPRQNGNSFPIMDGHCAAIAAAYREHRMSSDNSFLTEIWPDVKAAMEWMIRTADPKEEGVTQGFQWDTYDSAVSGPNTFIGSHYLSALAAAERMASTLGDADAAARYGRLRRAGGAAQDATLWNGEYFVQKPGPVPGNDYNSGCHSDHLIGQWWAHTLDNGYLYPREHVRSAARAIFRYNHRDTLDGFRQYPRPFVASGKGGLLNCTWPHGGRPERITLDADEVFTGVEYAVAALLIYEGDIETALTLLRSAADRYDGAANGGAYPANPFNDVECGSFYARAMSAWSILLAAQGFTCDGPSGVIGFRPRWRPEDHGSFFSSAEAWGLFRQRRTRDRQEDRIAIRWGKLMLNELRLELPTEASAVSLLAHVQDRPIESRLRTFEGGTAVTFQDRLVLKAGDELSVELAW